MLTDVNGVVTDCTIRTRSVEDGTLNFHFKDSPTKNKIIIKVSQPCQTLMRVE